MPTGADLLVESLHRHGVRTLFGMPGSHTIALYDALARHGGIRTILIRNEQAGAYAADGYARVTGQPGVICTTAGPGATNALSGIGEAWNDSIPVLLVAGQVNHDRMHQECGNYHEIDLEGIFRPCTKYVRTIMDNAAIPDAVQSAFLGMTSGRPRPAALFFPQDLQKQEGDWKAESLVSPPLSAFPAPADLDRAVELLQRSRRPIILAGGGALWANAGRELRGVAQRLDCPLVTTLNGKGILDERDPYSLGHARSARGRFALEHADLMLAVGCRFTEVMTGFRKLPVPQPLIQIDIDPDQIGMNHPVEVGLVGHAWNICWTLLKRLDKSRTSQWGDIWQQAKQAQPKRREWLIGMLREVLPDNAVVFTDACEMGYKMHFDYPAYAPRTFFYPSNYIALGWGFPAAVGAAVALPDRPVVCVSGDGGFVMNAQELATAAKYNLHVIAVIHDDSCLGAIKHQQQHFYQERYLDTDLHNPDFLQLANAYGVPATQAGNPEEFRKVLGEAVQRRGPSLIRVPDVWRWLR